MYKSHSGSVWLSELEEGDKALWRNRLTAALCVVGCARVVCILPEEDVAVCTEVQGFTVLLSDRVAATQLKVHLLPLQLALV